MLLRPRNLTIMKNSILPTIASTTAFAGVITVNALANILPINGMNTGEVSALYPSLFTPAGLTFSIWSIIYLLLFGFVVVQWTRINSPEYEKLYRSLTPSFLASCVLNMSWILAWHYLYVWLSVIIMVALLLSLIRLFLLLEQHKPTGFTDRIFTHLPFTIYLSWICVATIANSSTALISEGWQGGFLSEQTWTVILMSIATLLAALITFRFSKPAFAAVVLWALVGIFIRWKESSYELLTTSAVIMIGVLSLVMLYTLLKKTNPVVN
jgi:translocator protein